MANKALFATTDRHHHKASPVKLVHDRGIHHLTVVDHDGHLVGLLSEHVLMTPFKREPLDNFPFPVWLKETESRFPIVNRAPTEAAKSDRPDGPIGKNDLDLWPTNTAHRRCTQHPASLSPSN